MKKYIYASLFAAVAMMTATACSEDNLGAEPGNDSKPNVCVYQFTPTTADGDYDADNDVRVRVAANSATTDVYVTAVKDGANLSEAELISQAKSGTKVSLAAQPDGAKTADVFLTGLKGSNTIAAVAVDAKGNSKLTTSEFFGIDWQDVCTGWIYSRYAQGNINAAWSDEPKALQRRADIPSVYRVKNAYGAGNHAFITTIDEGGNTAMSSYFGKDCTYSACTLLAPLPYSYGSYGQVTIRDYYTAYGDYYDYNCLFEDGTIMVYAAYTVSAGRLATGWWQFSPE